MTKFLVKFTKPYSEDDEYEHRVYVESTREQLWLTACALGFVTGIRDMQTLTYVYDKQLKLNFLGLTQDDIDENYRYVRRGHY
jgi:hypothetical protein